MSDRADFLHSNEFKLFIFFMLTFTLFIHWGGDNAWSRYDTTEAIAENSSLDITNNSDNTWDKAVKAEIWEVINRTQYEEAGTKEKAELAREGTIELFREKEYPIFSDKAPVSSFIAVPPYLIMDVLVDSESRDIWLDRPISDWPVRLSFETSMKQFLIVLTISVLPGALLLVLIFYHLKDYIEDEKIALYSVVIAGVATPIFTYATSFFGVITAAFFGFASYTALQKGLTENKRLWIYSAGVLSALAYSTEYFAGIITLVSVLVLLYYRKFDYLFRFGAAAFVATLPLFAHNWLVTGNPFMPIFMSSAFHTPGPLGSLCSLYAACSSHFSNFVFEPYRFFNVLFRLFFYPTRGILFYSPILLLAIPGTYELYKRDKMKLVTYPGIFMLFMLFQALQLNWLGGVSFGPRYAIVGLPFLILPVALGLKKLMAKGKIWKIIIFGVFLISVFNVLLGFQATPGIEISSETYGDRLNSFSAIQPGFYNELVNRFEHYGPRSEVVMSLSDRYRGFEIIHRAPYGPEFIEIGEKDSRSILFSTNLIPLMILVTLSIFLIPEDERFFRFIGLIILVTLLAGSFSSSSHYIQGESYEMPHYIGGATNGSMEVIFYAEENEAAYIGVDSLAPHSSIPLEVQINDERTRIYNISGKERIHFPEVKEGRNLVRLEAPYCKPPGIQEDSSDYRCLSFALENLSTVSNKQLPRRIYEDGWHPEESNTRKSWRWMEDKSMVLWGFRGGKILNISASPHPKISGSELSVSLNDRNIENLSFAETTDHRVGLSSGSGYSKLEFESTKGCIRPLNTVGGSTDSRCLSFRIENLSLTDKDFSAGFYPLENASGETYRWMKEDAEIFFPSGEKGSEIEIELRPYRHLDDPEVNLTTSGKEVGSIQFNSSKAVRKKFTVKEEGLNKLKLQSVNGCARPAEYEDSADTRCLSFRLNSIKFKPVDTTPN